MLVPFSIHIGGVKLNQAANSDSTRLKMLANRQSGSAPAVACCSIFFLADQQLWELY
jgi:hypothetical protein